MKTMSVPKSIVSDQDYKSVSNFWRKMYSVLGITLDLSTDFHPQMDGQSERTMQTLEDLFRSCVLSWNGSWEDHFPQVEFAYNSCYWASTKMAAGVFHHSIGMSLVRDLWLVWMDTTDS